MRRTTWCNSLPQLCFLARRVKAQKIWKSYRASKNKLFYKFCPCMRFSITSHPITASPLQQSFPWQLFVQHFTVTTNSVRHTIPSNIWELFNLLVLWSMGWKLRSASPNRSCTMYLNLKLPSLSRELASFFLSVWSLTAFNCEFVDCVHLVIWGASWAQRIAIVQSHNESARVKNKY